MPSLELLILEQTKTIRLNELHRFLGNNGAACAYPDMYACIQKYPNIFKIYGQELQIIDNDERKKVLENMIDKQNEISKIEKVKAQTVHDSGKGAYKEYMSQEEATGSPYETPVQKAKRIEREGLPSANRNIDEGKAQIEPEPDGKYDDAIAPPTGLEEVGDGGVPVVNEATVDKEEMGEYPFGNKDGDKSKDTKDNSDTSDSANTTEESQSGAEENGKE